MSERYLIQITEITQRPWMINDNDELKSETKLVISNGYSGFDCWVQITVAGKQPCMEYLGYLTPGVLKKIVHVPELINDDDEVKFILFDNPDAAGEPLFEKSRPQKKIRHWKIYIGQDTHTDIGFTHYQEDLKHYQWPDLLDAAFAWFDENAGLDNNNRFKYTVEASYLLYDSYLISRNADEVEKLKEYIRDGLVGYSAGFNSPSLEIMGAEGLIRFYYFSQRHLKDMLGTGSMNVAYQRDNPSLPLAAVDVMVESGVKYMMFQLNPSNDKFNNNLADNSPYPRLFYLRGRNPDNKVLVYTQPCYSTNYVPFYTIANGDEFDMTRKSSNEIYSSITDKLMGYFISCKYPYDAVLNDFTSSDNSQVDKDVLNNVRELNAMTYTNGNRYVYPKFIYTLSNDYFQYMEEKYRQLIPTYKGTLENWWAFGEASASRERAVNRRNHIMLPYADFFAVLASTLSDVPKYPYEDIATAYKNMLLYDEHSFGGIQNPALQKMWRWKANTAISCGLACDKIIKESLSHLNSQINNSGISIAVYNALSWNVTNIAEVDISNLPEYFEIYDTETGERVEHQQVDEGKAVFVASGVPALGYKCYNVKPVPADKQAESPSPITLSSNTIENRYFVIKLDKTGAIESIKDKLNNNAEMVDKKAPYKMNQFIYHTTPLESHEVISTDTIDASVVSGKTGPVYGVLTADGTTRGADSIKRNIILYDSTPKIDIINEVVKSPAENYTETDEEGYFAFPFNMPDFTIRHDTPVGDIRPYANPDINDPESEQLYTSCTDHYTVNTWVDISGSNDYGITFAPVSAPLVQYGERRSFSFMYDYNTENPWIYSYVFNNKWFTNYPKSHPGNVTFKYSVASHAGGDWKSGRADRIGAEASGGLYTSVFEGSHKSGMLDGKKGRLISIDKDNVIMQTAKMAEANGNGLIIRFRETLGLDTKATVDLALLKPVSAWETDLVENNDAPLEINDYKVSFNFKGYGIKTIRLVRAGDIPPPEEVLAVTDIAGTLITWKESGESAFYEVFRDKTEDFIPGDGNYLASVHTGHYFDNSVIKGLSNNYYYKVRAAGPGYKGCFSPCISAEDGIIAASIPSVPADLKAEVLYRDRVQLSWQPSKDDVCIKGYKVYRNGELLDDISAVYNSFSDMTVSDGENTYKLTAYNHAGVCSDGNTVKCII